ncbi:molybdopterin biosynthesis protein MoeB [Sphingomonas sp. Leaf407]|uniref:HesA/MoeB/ThiF family protein n=1 Tax=unclassified Sphingomonas TaxID=196159 RepID=UPI0006F89B53|nr:MULTISPECIES: molybdopterin-synthase adenylyltransferase MoeB [unclassified Sphingomonas]KQN34250.1 molybdopterin biosynthesis protein MoeB [Sphingomonas sp. Leaf42]KQT30693.1 molybdopterin biosynthesis protein MoeB [Sphingomonas sp. Leaf407]
MTFSDAELDRYARHLVLHEVGGAGQAALKAARVVVIGAGGIGSPVLQYLAAGGVGTLVVIDDDSVDASNLQRQTLFGNVDIGRPKVAAAADAVARINPFVRVEPVAARIDGANAAELLAGADVVVDGCDNFITRLAVADAALTARVPLVSAAVGRFEGQLGVFRGWEAGRPCYRCFVGDDPARADTSCADQGVLGALTGVIGSMAALEAMRAIVGFGEDPAGKVLIADLLAFRFRTLTLPKDPGCRCAG